MRLSVVLATTWVGEGEERKVKVYVLLGPTNNVNVEQNGKAIGDWPMRWCEKKRGKAKKNKGRVNVCVVYD